MTHHGTRFYAQRMPYYNGVFLWISSVCPGDEHKRVAAKGIEYESEPLKNGVMTEPAMRLETQEAQELMDALWTAGLRPTEGSGSAGSLAAVQHHLEDMRRLVFDAKAKATT